MVGRDRFCRCDRLYVFFGWLIDRLFGSSPWGIVGGIVLGSVIGFMQLFRITSQIFGPDKTIPSEHPLLAEPEKAPVRKDTFDEP